MKTLTQVILPIVALAGLVFFITYITNYAPPSPANGPDKKTTAQISLRFTDLKGRREPHPAQMTPEQKLRYQELTQEQKQRLTHLEYWRDNYELGEKGHFDFWFTNENNQPVRLAWVKANCQCAGVELALVSPEAWEVYVNATMLACCPSASLPSILDALNSAHVRFLESMQWTPLDKNADAAVAAASPAGPQMGILRLNWTGKDTEGPKTISAEFVAQLPGANAEPIPLEVNFKVVPPFDVYSPSTRGRGIQLDDLQADSERMGLFYVSSRTRRDLSISVSANSMGENKECVSWSSPERLTENQIAQLVKENAIPSEMLDHQCIYRLLLTVCERKQIEQNSEKVTKKLDLGPLHFPLNVAAGEGKPIAVPVIGMVRGEVRIGDGSTSDKIDFGAAYPSSGVGSKKVTLASNRADFDLEVVHNECTPDYLQVTLEPDKDKQNGNKSWTLTVTIPPGKLFGSLADAFVILKTKDGLGRRIRIPVKATTYDSGPRL